MKTLKRSVALLTLALVASVFTTATIVSAEEAGQTATINKTEIKRSTTANKEFKNRRGYYDRYTDTWVYFTR